MLKENILRNDLLLNDLTGANILANIAVFAYLGVDAGVSLFLVYRKIGAVGFAVAAKGAAGGAILCLLAGIILRGACNHLNSLVRDYSNKMLGACICTVAAADALIRIYLGDTVYDGNSVVAAYSDAFAMSKAAGGTHSLLSQLKLSSFLAAANAKLVNDNGASSVTVAANEGNRALELSKIMKLINNDLFTALNSAGNAANTLFIVNNSMVINYGDSALGAGSLALAAGNAAVTADFSDELIVFLGGRTGYKVSCIGRDHADKALGAYAFLGAVTAAIALLLVNNDLAVNKLHSALGAAQYA